MDVRFDFHGLTARPASQTVRIGQGPGRVRVNVREWLGSLEHATRVTAATLTGAPASISVERLMVWEQAAGQGRGHSTRGWRR